MQAYTVFNTGISRAQMIMINTNPMDSVHLGEDFQWCNLGYDSLVKWELHVQRIVDHYSLEYLPRRLEKRIAEVYPNTGTSSGKHYVNWIINTQCPDWTTVTDRWKWL
jgi:hypothetical protein